MKPVISVTNIFPQPAIDKLQPVGDLRLNPSGSAPSKQQLIEMAKESHALITYLSDKIDREILESAPHLKIVANYAAGFNNIDLDCAKERNVWVTNTPSILHETTADLTWALILGAARRIVPSDRYTREGHFTGWGAQLFLGGDVWGKTLGVIGCGEIGGAVARRALGFNMKVLYHQRTPLSEAKELELNATFAPFDQLIAESDFVTLHVPLTEETRYMIGKKELEQMKPTAYLINTARGKVVDDQALVDALKEGVIAGAALDVYEDEPKLTPGMIALDNLILLPHIGSASFETRDRMALHVADNVIAALNGQTPPSNVYA